MSIFALLRCRYSVVGALGSASIAASVALRTSALAARSLLAWASLRSLGSLASRVCKSSSSLFSGDLVGLRAALLLLLGTVAAGLSLSLLLANALRGTHLLATIAGARSDRLSAGSRGADLLAGEASLRNRRGLLGTSVARGLLLSVVASVRLGRAVALRSTSVSAGSLLLISISLLTIALRSTVSVGVAGSDGSLLGSGCGRSDLLRFSRLVKRFGPGMFVLFIN